MNEKLEMVEELRTKMNVSYEEAKNALEAADWNMLDAIIALERQGSTSKAIQPEVVQAEQTQEQESPKAEQASGQEQNAQERTKQREEAMGKIKQNARNFIRFLKENSFCVFKEEHLWLTMPGWCFALAMLFGWHGLTPLMVIGLFFGLRYSFTRNEEGQKPQEMQEVTE